MAALSLRGSADPERLERVLEVRGQAIAEYFVSEVLDQQPAEVAQFMLDTSILEVLTAEACAAVTGRQDGAALLRAIGAAHLFLVALDDERTSFRYHHLVRRVLRAELRGQRPGPRARAPAPGRPSGTRLPGTRGVRPITIWRRSSPAGGWRCCRTGWCPTSCMPRP